MIKQILNVMESVRRNQALTQCGSNTLQTVFGAGSLIKRAQLIRTRAQG